MCGIAGGLRLGSHQLDEMLAAMRHRGPDGEGRFQRGAFRGGMTRLAILDAAHGKQPFISEEGQIHAIFNGEIYNWQQIRRLLEAQGHRFKTRCDGEILPAAWLEWGPKFPEKLNGMFALAVHDARNDVLFLARDRCGQKPLYYTQGGNFLFASEIKALAAAGHRLEPDATHLATWLSLRYLPEPLTLFKDIVTLPAAHWMTVDAQGRLQQQRYWTPGKMEKSELTTETEIPLDFLDRTSRSAVELALQADVPLAAYLSGGVDSALLAHYVKDLGAEVTTVSISFGAASDETAAAAATAKHLGLPHFPTHLGPRALDDLPRVIRQMELPVGDALILAFDHLASHTAALGCKVALGGEGPDEHFAGYSFQSAYLAASKLGSHGRSLASTAIRHLPCALLDKIANFPAALGPQGREKIARYLQEFDHLSSFHRATNLHTLFEAHEIANILHPEIRTAQQAHPIIRSIENDLSFPDLLALQYRHWLPDWSLIRQDKNSMAHSLEYRAPFLDHRLIDFALGHPEAAEIWRGNKHIWRSLAARHLPATITQRPKQPFYLPLEHPSWREPLIAIARETLTTQSIGRHGWLHYPAIEPLFSARTFLPLKQLAALVILQMWLDGFAHGAE